MRKLQNKKILPSIRNREQQDFSHRISRIKTTKSNIAKNFLKKNNSGKKEIQIDMDGIAIGNSLHSEAENENSDLNTSVICLRNQKNKNSKNVSKNNKTNKIIDCDKTAMNLKLNSFRTISSCEINKEFSCCDDNNNNNNSNYNNDSGFISSVQDSSIRKMIGNNEVALHERIENLI